MPHIRRYTTALAALLPAGALGLSSALAAAPDQPRQQPRSPDPAISGLGDATHEAEVANQLKAVRQAMSELAGPKAAEQKLAWWWFRNFWPNFRNYWPNWGNYWRNW